MGFKVEDLSHSLGFRISDIEQQADESGTTLNKTVDGILNSDDKLLSSLQKLGWELDQQDPEEAQTVERLREVCMRYASLPLTSSTLLKGYQVDKKYRRDTSHKVGQSLSRVTHRSRAQRAMPTCIRRRGQGAARRARVTLLGDSSRGPDVCGTTTSRAGT